MSARAMLIGNAYAGHCLLHPDTYTKVSALLLYSAIVGAYVWSTQAISTKKKMQRKQAVS